MSPFPRIEPLGEAALLVRFSDHLDDAANRACLAFRAALQATPPVGVVETASSLGSVLVRVSPGAPDPTDDLMDRLALRDWSAVPLPSRKLWRVPCAYGGEAGPQLAEAAALAGVAEADAIAELSQSRVRVLALGFAPGMPYLGILPPRWDLPRQTGLTPKVPEGALVIAVRQVIVFGTEAPTGWRRIGMTRFGCFRPDRAPAIALSPGDEIMFPAVSPAELEDRAAADHSGFGGAVWEALP